MNSEWSSKNSLRWVHIVSLMAETVFPSPFIEFARDHGGQRQYTMDSPHGLAGLILGIGKMGVHITLL